MLVLNLPFKALMFLTLMRLSLVLFLVLWLKLVKYFLKVRCRLALLPFLISCLIWFDLVASLQLIFFFQAEDGIRDVAVTGVQTCALPISYLLARWNAGCHTAMRLFRELQPQGYTGSYACVAAYARRLRQAQGLSPGQRRADRKSGG